MPKIELDKVLAVLSKHGIEKEVMDEVELELTDEAPVDEPVEPKEENKEPAPAEPSVEEEGATPSESEPEANESDVPPAEDTPAVDDVPPTDEAPVLPEAEPENSGLPEGATEVDLSQPVPAPTEPEAPVSDEPSVPAPVDFEAKLAEKDKVINALDARLSSLEEALQKSGILSVEKPSGEYGVDDPTNIGDSRDDETVMEDVLAEINRKH